MEGRVNMHELELLFKLLCSRDRQKVVGKVE